MKTYWQKLRDIKEKRVKHISKRHRKNRYKKLILFSFISNGIHNDLPSCTLEYVSILTVFLAYFSYDLRGLHCRWEKAMMKMQHRDQTRKLSWLSFYPVISYLSKQEMREKEMWSSRWSGTPSVVAASNIHSTVISGLLTFIRRIGVRKSSYYSASGFPFNPSVSFDPVSQLIIIPRTRERFLFEMKSSHRDFPSMFCQRKRDEVEKKKKNPFKSYHFLASWSLVESKHFLLFSFSYFCFLWVSFLPVLHMTWCHPHPCSFHFASCPSLSVLFSRLLCLQHKSFLYLHHFTCFPVSVLLAHSLLFCSSLWHRPLVLLFFFDSIVNTWRDFFVSILTFVFLSL